MSDLPKVMNKNYPPEKQARIFGDNVSELWRRTSLQDSTISTLQAAVSSIQSTLSNLSLSVSGGSVSSITASPPLYLPGSNLDLGHLSSIGSPNYIPGVNAAASAWEYKQLLGTVNQVSIAHAAGMVTWSLPQDIHTTANPAFNTVNVATYYNIGSNIVVSIDGTDNLKLGVDAGQENTTGKRNVDVGAGAGHDRTTANDCLNFGTWAGYKNNASNNLNFGSQAGYYNVSGIYNTNIGPYAGNQNLTSYITCIGNAAGQNGQNCSRMVAIGNFAGRYETASQRLYIDSYDRVNLAAGRTDSLIYGYFNSNPANQYLRVNGSLQIYKDCTGASYYFYLGGGNDFGLGYDGTDAIINSGFVGASDILVTCGANKTIELQNNVYDDWYFEIAPKTTGAGKPSLVNFSGNINQYQMAVNDITELRPIELAHKWDEATQIEIHVHWATNGVDGTNRGVKWEIDYTWANGLAMGGTTAFAAATTVSNETQIPANTPDKTYMYTSVVSFTPAGGKIGAGLLMSLKRIASVTDPTPTSDPWIIMVGVHYQVNTMGSRQIAAK